MGAVLVELNRQVTSAVELIGIRLLARVAEAETQVGRFTEIDSGISSELLNSKVLLRGLLDDNIVDGQIPRSVVGHAVETHKEGAGTRRLKHA